MTTVEPWEPRGGRNVEPPPAPALPVPAHSGPPAPRTPGPAVHQTDQRLQGATVVLLAWIIALLTLLYMVPWAIAVTRGRSNQAAIGLINLLAGWSVIGWIVSLVMACQAHQVVGQTTVASTTHVHYPSIGQSLPGPGWYPAPDGRGQQYWDGASWTSHRAP